MGEHLCHARGCTIAVPPAKLMCRRHWFMVPAALRRLIWHYYRPGQEIDKQPSEAYLRVMLDAIAAVAEKEAGDG